MPTLGAELTPMRILLIRHAQSQGNAAGRILGGDRPVSSAHSLPNSLPSALPNVQPKATLDPEAWEQLTARGHDQAAALGRWLAHQPQASHLMAVPWVGLAKPGRWCSTIALPSPSSRFVAIATSVKLTPAFLRA